MTRRTHTRTQQSDSGHRRIASDAEPLANPIPSARCPICATRVCADDALGVTDGEPAHAECALVHWLLGSEPGNRQARPLMSRRDSRSETIAFIEGVESLFGEKSGLDP
jgi:hypothetical protein